MDTVFLLKVASALFAIMNPFANLPIFLGLTDGMETAQRQRIALTVIGYSAIACAVVALGGASVLSLFGVTVDGLRVAGGLVLLLIGLGMLNGKDSDAHQGASAEKPHMRADDISFYPMTFPILTGPGAIATLIIFSGQAGGAMDMLSIALAVAVNLASVGVVLYFAANIGARMSLKLRIVMTRLMGMILTAIAVEMIVGGLKALLPGLA